MKQNILVTGGAGYIGSHFVYRLLKEKKYNIHVIDIFSQGKENIIRDRSIHYHNVDLKKKTAVFNFFSNHNIDLVAHFAALANVPDSVKNPADYYQNNIVGGLNLLEAMREHKVNKIIFSSSAAVYGEPKSSTIKEDHPKSPTNPYGYTKLVFENFLQDYHRSYGLRSVSFRYFCAAGCDKSLAVGEHHQPETHIIPLLIATAMGKRKKFFVYGNDYPTKDGTGIRDYIHVSDLAEAHMLASKRLNRDVCEFYNLGINKGYSVLELIKITEKITGKKINYQIAPRRPGDPSQLIANASAAMKTLRWKPNFTTIEDIVRSAYLYTVKNHL